MKKIQTLYEREFENHKVKSFRADIEKVLEDNKEFFTEVLKKSIRIFLKARAHESDCKVE